MGVFVCVCVCVRARDIESERVTHAHKDIENGNQGAKKVHISLHTNKLLLFSGFSAIQNVDSC